MVVAVETCCGDLGGVHSLLQHKQRPPLLVSGDGDVFGCVAHGEAYFLQWHDWVQCVCSFVFAVEPSTLTYRGDHPPDDQF